MENNYLDRKITEEEITLFKEILEYKRKKEKTKKLEKLRCAIYARKSQEDTKDTSLQTQINYCKMIIDSCEMLELKGVYSEDKQSGMIEERPEFQRVMAGVAGNDIDVVICYRLDRFSRKLQITQKYEEIIRLNHAYLLAGDVTQIPDTASKMFIHQIFEATAELKARDTAEKVVNTFTDMARKGKYVCGKPPIGYECGFDGKLEINLDESVIIDKIFSSFLGGKSLSAIVKELNEKGVCTKNGNPFSKQAIHSILKNEVYAGTLIYNRKNAKGKKRKALLKKGAEVRVEDNHPAIVSKSDFKKVQKMLNNNAELKINDSKYIYLLSGLIKCKSCGKMMVGNSHIARKPQKGEIYLRLSW